MKRRQRKPQQHELRFRSWGGRRPGAGRPRSPKSGVAHDARPTIAARFPVHVTLKLRRELGSLRTKRKAAVIRKSIAAAVAGGFRVIDWSIQRDHIHLVVEPGSAERLRHGMQGLSIRIARGLNGSLGRTGKVFADRYHVHVLKTPREVRHARAYVLLNARKHAAQGGRSYPAGWLDPYSSGESFDGWQRRPRGERAHSRTSPPPQMCSAPPQTWLMRVGWRRHGLVRINEVPGNCS